MGRTHGHAPVRSEQDPRHSLPNEQEPHYPDGAGDLPMGQHFPRGVGSPRQKAQGVGSSPVAQLCRGPSQVRKNAQKPATFLSMQPARPEAPQGQAPGLNNPGKGRGGAELASAAGFSLQPCSAVQRQPSTACLSPASLPGEGRSHLKLHLAHQPTEPQEAGCCQRSPGSHPGQQSTSQWASLQGHRSPGPQEKSRKPHCSKRVKPVQAPHPAGLRGRPILPLCPGASPAQQEHRKDLDREMGQPERQEGIRRDGEVVRVTKNRRQH